MVETHNFEYRKITMPQQWAIKESFHSLDCGDCISFNMVVGLDSNYNIVKPVVYSAKGFVSLQNAILPDEVTPERIKAHLGSKRGTYSFGAGVCNVQGQHRVETVTTFICIMKGRVSKVTGEYVSQPVCELYAPCSFEAREITASRIVFHPQSNSAFFLNTVKNRLVNRVRGSIISRERFLFDRMRGVC